MSKIKEMRLTLKKVEQAKKAVQEARAQQEIVRKWNDTMKTIGNTGDQKVTAMIFNEDMDELLRTECDPNGNRPILKAG